MGATFTRETPCVHYESAIGARSKRMSVSARVAQRLRGPAHGPRTPRGNGEKTRTGFSGATPNIMRTPRENAVPKDGKGLPCAADVMGMSNLNVPRRHVQLPCRLAPGDCVEIGATWRAPGEWIEVAAIVVHYDTTDVTSTDGRMFCGLSNHMWHAAVLLNPFASAPRGKYVA